MSKVQEMHSLKYFVRLFSKKDDILFPFPKSRYEGQSSLRDIILLALLTKYLYSSGAWRRSSFFRRVDHFRQHERIWNLSRTVLVENIFGFG